MTFRFISLTGLTILSALAAHAGISFQQGIAFQTLPGPLASIAADLNGDSALDLVVSNTAVSSVSVYLGKGDGTFQTRVDYSTAGCQPGQLIAADFNRDGKLDLVGTCTLTTKILFLPGRGDGTFGAPVYSNAPLPIVSGFLENFIQPVTAADVNGDGVPDLALIIQTSAMLGLGSAGAIGQSIVMTGNGDGTFGHATTLNIAPAGTEPWEVELADVNGDGKADIVGVSFLYNNAGLAPPYTAYLFVALGDGRGGFQLAHSYPMNGIPESGFQLADVNGDGKVDAVFIGLNISAVLSAFDGSDDTSTFSGVGVFTGNGDGTFRQSYAAFDSQAQQVQLTVSATLAKVQGTQFPDLVTTVMYQDLNGDATTGAIVVRPNKGDGTFGPPQSVTPQSATIPFAIQSGDFNSDGNPDILTFGYQVNLLGLIFSDPNLLNNIDLIGGSIAGYPSATVSMLLNNNPATFTDTNSASFAAGPVAAGSIVAAFGTGLASSTATATTQPLPTTLAGASVTVTDSAGVQRPAALFYASPTQINYLIPDAAAAGTATVTISNGSRVYKAQQQILAVAPGIFNASGPAVGQVLTVDSSGLTTVTSLVQAGANGAVTATPITVNAIGKNVFVVLYGTGLRNHKAAATATIAGMTLPVAYAGAQGTFTGEDQVNLSLPASLAGAGLTMLTISVDGVASNAVQLLLK